MKNGSRTKALTAYAFLAPSLIGLVCFSMLPFFFSLFVSLTDWNFTDGIGKWNFTGIKNFIALWSDEWFVAALKNTFIYTVVTVPVGIILSLIMAALINEFIQSRLADLVRVFMYMPHICNIVAISAIWKAFYAKAGLFTSLMRLVGWEEPPRWLSDYFWALPAVMLVSIWEVLGYRIFIYSASLQGVSRELYEAAEMDGAGRIRRFVHITVPMLRPTTFFLTIVGIIGSFKVFGVIQVMTRGGPGYSTYTLVYYIYTSAFIYYRMGYASAVAVILFIICLLMTIYQWRRNQRAEDYL
jgi:multiple sugar transport system permease protein